ncbi:hypothetical protein ACFVT2_30065 [Streptomyces sp. NPDC058000]|uniref:hypothetical protein n=1 Tax=Streptomyces sp. NPDC058000 TaxID=3346299 RepID=UPI0036E753CE
MLRRSGVSPDGLASSRFTQSRAESHLRESLLDTIDRAHGHLHWDTLADPDLVQARMKIKHVDDEGDD